MGTTDAKLVSVEGILRLSQSTELTQKVELWLLNDDVNRNNWQYLNLKEHMAQFVDTPILIAYKGKQIGDGHNFDEVRNPDGSVTPSFMSATAERIVGFIKSIEDIRLETINNKHWIVATGYIWKWYARELVAKLNGQGGGKSEMSVSIETLIDEMHMDGDTEVFTKYTILGTTILGDSVAPAVADASIKALSAIGQASLRELTLRVASANNPQPTEDESNGTAEGAKKQQKKGLSFSMNKNRLQELVAKVPNHRILAVSDDKVLMLNAKDDLFMADVIKENDDLDVGKKVAVNATVVVAEGENSVSFELSDVLANNNAQIKELTDKLNASESAKEVALTSLGEMQKKENARRINAIKVAIKNRLAEIKANTEADIDDDACDALLADESVKAYAEMEDAEGNFVGDERACKEVDSICMNAVLKANATRRNNAQHKFSFEQILGGDDSSDTLDGILSRISE